MSISKLTLIVYIKQYILLVYMHLQLLYRAFACAVNSVNAYLRIQ